MLLPQIQKRAVSEATHNSVYGFRARKVRRHMCRRSRRRRNQRDVMRLLRYYRRMRLLFTRVNHVFVIARITLSLRQYNVKPINGL